MKTNRLINFLHYSFRTLYGASFFLGILFLIVISPLWSEFGWHQRLSDYDLPANGSRVLDDSTTGWSNNMSWRTPIRDRSKDFPYQLFYRKKNYILVDTTGRDIWEHAENRLKYAPDSIQQLIATSLQLAKQQQEAKIDSLLRAEPEIYIVRIPKQRHYVLEPTISATFQLRMAGSNHLFPNSDKISFKDWLNIPKSWQYTLQQVPNIIVHQDAELFTSKDYYLRFRYRTWREFKALPFMAVILGWSTLLLQWAAWLAGLYQFKRMFDDLRESRYFSDRQAVRLKRAGWVMIGYFIGYFLLLNLQNLYAKHYFENNGFYVDQFFPIMPDHWLILFAGLTLLVFAQIFRYGHQLKEESELTI